jgi:hypothetical protein
MKQIHARSLPNEIEAVVFKDDERAQGAKLSIA